MSIRELKRATLLLTVSYIVLSLILNDTTQDCNEEDENRRVVGRQFRKAVARHANLEEFCIQSTDNSNHSVSLLALGSVDLSGSIPDLVAERLQVMSSDIDVVAWTLASPLLYSSSSNILSVLRGVKLGLVSLATETMSSSGEDSIKKTIHYLGEAGLYWLGLIMRSGNIFTVNGLRLGVLAYCAVYRECGELTDTPYSTVRYTAKTASTDIKSLKSRGVDVIIVIVRWGRHASLLPDETALVTARYLSSQGVALIIGDHPALQQNHAYFDNTLVIFSMGSFSRHLSSSHLCWKEAGGERMEYSMSEECQLLHPKLHSTLMTSEQHTTLYYISLSRSSLAVAEYLSVPLIRDGSGLQWPRLHNMKRTKVCSSDDLHCLSCHPF